MDAFITGFQIVCAAGLVLGATLALYQQLTQRGGQSRHHGYSAANDFEIGYRRARGRR
jgi:hypothetical protein